MKVFELAKQLNQKATETLKKLKDAGADVNSINSVVSDADMALLADLERPVAVEMQGQFVSNIAFVRKLDGENYEVCLGQIDELNNFNLKKSIKFESRVRAYHELNYHNSLIEMERVVNV